jgi:branched-chain amino acid transport system permease protein
MTFASLWALLWIVNRTKMGLHAGRIHGSGRGAAHGIDVNKTISFTFGIGSLLAGLGGIMWTLKYPSSIPSWDSCPG